MVLFLLFGGGNALAYPAPRSDTDPPARAPNRLIVKVKAELQTQAALAAEVGKLAAQTGSPDSPHISPLVPVGASDNAGLSASAGLSHPAARVFTLDFADGVNLDQIKAEIEAQPGVEYAEYDWRMELFEAPNDPLFSGQWGIQNTGQTIPVVDRIEGYYNDTIMWVDCTPGFDVDFGAMYSHPGPHSLVIVGIIDTGSDTEHEDLADNLWRNPGEIPDNGIDDDHNGYVDDYFGYDFSGDSILPPQELIPDSNPTDLIGHGTHVAGIVAAVTDNTLGVAGLAESARIITLKVFPNAFNSIIARAIYYGVDNGVDIFNMSFGGPFPSITISDAVAYARSRGVLPVAAAGNDGAAAENYPAVDTAVMSVGALDYTGRVADFSTYGAYLDLVAPGVSIISLRAAETDLYARKGEPNVHIIADRYYLADGTSMSTPYVVGCAAALAAVESGMSAERLIEVLESSCVDLVDPMGTGESWPGWDWYSGFGLVNLGRALGALTGITLKIESPQEGEILSGMVSIVGTAAGPEFTGYRLEYGLGRNPDQWITLTMSEEPIVDGEIVAWNTTGLTGTCTLRLFADVAHQDRVTVLLANSSATSITAPQDGDTVSLVEAVYGSTVAPDYLRSIVSFAPESNPGDTTIAWSGTAPVVSDTICAWTVDAQTEGWYYLKLTTVAQSATVSDSVLVYIKNPFHAGWPVRLSNYAYYAPAAADVEGDGKIEFVVPTRDGTYIYDDDGTPFPNWPVNPVEPNTFIPAIADLDQNDSCEIIFVADGLLHVYTLAGEIYKTPRAIWPRDVSGKGGLGKYSYSGSMWGSAIPVVCDLDGQYNQEGSPHILVIDPTGTVRAFDDMGLGHQFSDAGGLPTVNVQNTVIQSFPRASVINVDAIPAEAATELIVAGDGLWIYDANGGAPYNESGSQIRDYHATYGLAVGNFDVGVGLEIAVLYQPHGSHVWHLEVMKPDGTPLPGWPISTGISDETYLLHSLTVGDVDGDGLPEIFVTPYMIGHGLVMAYHADGTPLLSENIDGRFFEFPSSISLAALTDVTGDGRPEIVVKVGLFFGGSDPEQVYALTADGEIVPGYPLRFGNGISTELAMPLTVDLQGDGSLNMFTLDSASLTATVWDFPVPYGRAGRPWPRYRRDNWNSGILPSPISFNSIYLVKLIHCVFPPYEVKYFPPYEIPDANCDGRLELLDLVILVNYIYRMGPKPCMP